MHGGNGPAVQVETGDVFENVVGADEHRNVVGVEDLAHAVKPFLGHEERAGLVAGVEGAAQHLGGFGQVEPALGFDLPAQGHVREARVIGHAGVFGIGQADDALFEGGLCHGRSSRTAGRPY